MYIALLEGYGLREWEVNATSADLIDTLLIRLKIKAEFAAKDSHGQ